jgi:hypothetical protein
MERNTLRLSEIILGLRIEYKYTALQLNNLRKHLRLDAGVTPKFGIYSNEVLNKDNVVVMKNYYTMLYLSKKLNILEKMLRTITNKNLTYEEMYNYVSTKRQNYFLTNDKNLFKVDDLIEFYRDCDKILLNDFNTGLLDKYKKVNDDGLKVKLGHDGIFACTDLKSQSQPIIGVDYIANRDQLVLNNYYGDPFFYDKAQNILNTQIPMDIIDERLVSIINNNKVSTYPIEFEGLNNSKQEQAFNLEVRDDYVLARRVK